LRFGVGNDFASGRQADYVLSNFTDEDHQTLDERIEMAIKIVQGFTTNGIDRTMSEFNGK
jgi:PTH1 family peptidyl-tRNA hydrolase